jgi:1-acyl-sn-glycerol-3-phosphate acyltransferase
MDLGHWLRVILWRLSHFFVAWPFGKLFFGFEVRGLQHVPLRGGVLAAANHASYLDPPILGNATPRVMYYMARADLFGGKFFGRLIRMWGAFPIGRNMASAGGLKEAVRKLEEGKLVMFFPEGTRTYDGELRTAMVGAGLLAHLAGVPVVPAYVEGTYESYPRGAKFPRPAKVVVSFGPPVDLARLRGRSGSKEVYREIAAEIMSALASLRDQLRGGPKRTARRR